MKKTFYSIIFFLVFIPGVAKAQAAATSAPAVQENAPEGLVAVPAIITEETKIREIFDYKIKLKNNFRRQVTFFTFVNDLNEEAGRQKGGSPSELDRQTSLASWATIKRAGTDIAAGEEIEIPLNIKISQDALPGRRHAAISFVESSNYNQAQAVAAQGGGTQVLLNFEIREEIVERARLLDFFPKTNVFVKPPLEFSFRIENSGNRPMLPVGRLLFYDRRNSEIAEQALFAGADSIPAGETKEFFVQNNELKKIGKYKARLEIEYGDQSARDMQDTAYFWVIPFPWLIAVFAGLFVALLLLTILIFRRTYHHAHPLVQAEHFPAEEKGHVLDLRK